jgi:hypothetical protein
VTDTRRVRLHADTATTLHDAPDRSDDAVLHAIVWDACLALRNVVSGRVPAQLKLLEMNLIPALLYLLGDDSASEPYPQPHLLYLSRSLSQSRKSRN